jgi:hypothetical protein
MMEIMGSKAHNPVSQKLLEKVRPNYYRLTALGRATAGRLLKEDVPTTSSQPVRVRELYETASAYLARPEFRRWRDHPEEPRDWSGAAGFLGLTGRAAGFDPAERLDEIHTAVRAAIDWCNVQEAAFLTRGAGQGGTPIHVRDLAELLDFLQALKYRFPDQLEKKLGKKKRV